LGKDKKRTKLQSSDKKENLGKVFFVKILSRKFLKKSENNLKFANKKTIYRI